MCNKHQELHQRLDAFFDLLIGRLRLNMIILAINEKPQKIEEFLQQQLFPEEVKKHFNSLCKDSEKLKIAGDMATSSLLMSGIIFNHIPYLKDKLLEFEDGKTILSFIEKIGVGDCGH